MDKIQKSLDDLERKVKKSINIVSKGDGMKLGDAIKLGRKSNSICSTIKKEIGFYQDFQPTEPQANQILTKMRGIVDLTEKQLSLMVQHKGQFEKLHVGGLVKKNMGKTNDVGVELAKIMVAKAPQSIKQDSIALDQRRKSAFDNAIAAFANSVGGEDQADEEDDSD